VRREVQPVMTERRMVDWRVVSRVKVLMMIVVGMMEGNSRNHLMMMLMPETTGGYWAAELRHDMII
jgi:hypothetical protein